MEEILIRYVGKKAKYRDHLYGSNTEWEPGQSQPVPVKFAAKLLQHPEFQDMRHKSKQGKGLETAREPEPEVINEAPLVSLETMTKEAISQYAYRYFGTKLDTSIKKGELIDKVRLIMGGAPVGRVL
jgi:hypothetical protein